MVNCAFLTGLCFETSKFIFNILQFDFYIIKREPTALSSLHFHQLLVEELMQMFVLHLLFIHIINKGDKVIKMRYSFITKFQNHLNSRLTPKLSTTTNHLNTPLTNFFLLCYHLISTKLFPQDFSYLTTLFSLKNHSWTKKLCRGILFHMSEKSNSTIINAITLSWSNNKMIEKDWVLIIIFLLADCMNRSKLRAILSCFELYVGPKI